MFKLLILLFSFASFASMHAADAAKPAAPGQTAICHVCEYNRDLACVEFKVKATTPRLTYTGKEYCFCGEECRKVFEKNPAKYAARAR